ncbi:MAG TPA: hypothetical protein VLM38_21470 [Blastocatellia bacterium]|nr:hypothetical protein [Blastocatellia bacterium]
MTETQTAKFKYSVAFLFCAVLTAQVVVFASLSRGSVPADEWDEVFDTAREVLAHLPDADRIATIKDASLREAVQRAYRELKSCAKVNRNQSRAVKQAAVAAFERAFKDVEREADRSEYRDCAGKCKSDVAGCEKDCAAARRKICGCKISQFGCLVTKCVFG